MTKLRVHRPWDRTFERFDWPEDDVPRKLRAARDNGASAHRDGEPCDWCERASEHVRTDEGRICHRFGCTVDHEDEAS